MRIFDDAPGVEWSPDSADPEQTVPLTPTTSQVPFFDPYPTACPVCGSELGVDGYCMTCGAKAKTLREHYEMAPTDWVAGVCDIGRLHTRNEDALDCKADGTRAVLVVCDGVTTSQESDVASMTAARMTCDLLWASNPQGMGTPQSRVAAMASAITDAIAQANQAVIGSTSSDIANSAASTIAVGIIDGPEIFAANLGDSRVYWLPDDAAPTQLTKDHSLAQADMDLGTGRAEAESSAFAHTITKWLGVDSQDVVPFTSSVIASGSGWLIVCSDGLWNYASEATALARAVAQANASTPVELAVRLTTWANEQGGHDNITVACARVTVEESETVTQEPTPVREESIPTQPSIPPTDSQGDPRTVTQSDAAPVEAPAHSGSAD